MRSGDGGEGPIVVSTYELSEADRKGLSTGVNELPGPKRNLNEKPTCVSMRRGRLCGFEALPGEKYCRLCKDAMNGVGPVRDEPPVVAPEYDQPDDARGCYTAALILFVLVIGLVIAVLGCLRGEAPAMGYGLI